MVTRVHIINERAYPVYGRRRGRRRRVYRSRNRIFTKIMFRRHEGGGGGMYIYVYIHARVYGQANKLYIYARRSIHFACSSKSKKLTINNNRRGKNKNEKKKHDRVTARGGAGQLCVYTGRFVERARSPRFSAVKTRRFFDFFARVNCKSLIVRLQYFRIKKTK